MCQLSYLYNITLSHSYIYQGHLQSTQGHHLYSLMKSNLSFSELNLYEFLSHFSSLAALLLPILWNFCQQSPSQVLYRSLIFVRRVHYYFFLLSLISSPVSSEIIWFPQYLYESQILGPQISYLEPSQLIVHLHSYP